MLESSVALLPMDYIGPALGAGIFVTLMSLIPNPARRNFNAIFAAGAVGAYIGGGFGVWELIYPALATPVVYLGLRSYRALGIAWLMHAAWDLPHHVAGHPIWPFVRASSFGCMIFDSLIAVWFLSGAPSFQGGRDPETSHSREISRRAHADGGRDIFSVQQSHRGERPSRRT